MFKGTLKISYFRHSRATFVDQSARTPEFTTVADAMLLPMETATAAETAAATAWVELLAARAVGCIVGDNGAGIPSDAAV